MKFLSEVNLEVFLMSQCALWLRDMPRDQERKMKEIDELVANFLCLHK